MNGKELLSNLKFNESYSKYKKDLNRKETWEESCDDVMSMHYNKFSKLDNWKEIKPYYDLALDSYRNMEILASQRNLQFREQHITKHNARLYNCSSLYIDRIEAFTQIFYILLCGCGVGYSVEKRFIDKLPQLQKRNENNYFVHLIEDSIEGWSSALGILLNSYFYGSDKVIFDYSNIRPKGSLIANEFLAPGHEGLEKSLNLIDKILQDKVTNNDFKLTSLNCHDIICLISDSVLSGGVRRCLAGDDDVLSMRGLIKMKDILIGEKVLTHTGEYKKVSAKVNNGIQKLLKIKTNCGDYYSTENHIWAIAKNLDGDINWKITSELKKGDVFIFNNTIIPGIKTFLPESDEFEVPDLDTDMAWFIGYFLGNGSCSKRIRKNKAEDNKFRISYPINYDLEVKIQTQFSRFSKSFGITNNKAAKEITSSKKVYAEYFLKHFKQPNTEIEIPNCIKQGTEEIRLSFLAGLLDSDGSVREETRNGKGTGQISIVCSKYYNFCRAVQALISSSGIPTKLKIDNRGNSYSVKTVDSYFRKILIEKLMVFSIKLKDDYFFNDVKKEKNGIFYPKHLCNKKGQKRNLFNNNYIASYKKIYLDNKIGTGFIPVVIDEITIYKEDNVYDIEIEDNHSFFINGILTHNSALISLFDKDDDLMLKCKTDDWWIKTPWRARANNSIKLLKSELTKEEFDSYKESIKQFGEPGIVLVDDIDFCGNPCLEIGFIPRNPKTGNSCISFCNLNEIIGSKCTTEEKFYKACKAAAILGTFQASYTDFPFLGKDTEELVRWEALLGVSITGFMNNPKLLFNPEILEKGVAIIKETNEIVAKLIGINPAARLTCTKPSGNASVLAMTASGIHPSHAKRYFRIVQLNKENPVAKYLKKEFPDLLEEGVWSATNSDYACYIPIDETEDTVVKSDIDEIKFLNMVKLVYKHWVLPGTIKDRGYSNAITHNVSNTVSVKDWDTAFDYIYDNKEYYCGLSFLPDTGDKIYKQAPFTEVLTLAQLVDKYKDAAIFASGLIVDALHCFTNDLWDACNASSDKSFQLTGDRVTVLLKKDIVMRIKKFARNYFKGNMDKTIECLKDIHLYHKYVKIQRLLSHFEINFNNVDYSHNMLKADELSGISCSGGSCEITII